MSLKRATGLLLAFLIVAGCDERPSQDDINALLMKYYPSAAFDVYPSTALEMFTAKLQKWGFYVVYTEAPTGAKVCKADEQYRGYIVMRASLAEPRPQFDPLIYLVSPNGDVWTTPDTPNIPIVNRGIFAAGHIVDLFITNKDKWTRYGKLTRNGNEVGLKLAKTGKTITENVLVRSPMRPRDRYYGTGLKPGVNC